MQPRSILKRRMDAGEPVFRAQSFLIMQDRILPNPSPSANLAGIWKGNGRKNSYRWIAGGFLFFLFSPALLRKGRQYMKWLLPETVACCTAALQPGESHNA